MKIKTGKIVSRYETTFYIQQYYVNWEFLAEPYSKSILHISNDTKTAPSSRYLKFFAANERSALDIHVDQYFTEKSYSQGEVVVEVTIGISERFPLKSHYAILHGYRCLNPARAIQYQVCRILHPLEYIRHFYTLSKTNKLSRSDQFDFDITITNKPILSHKTTITPDGSFDSVDKFKTNISIPVETSSPSGYRVLGLQQISNATILLLGQLGEQFTVPKNTQNTSNHQRYTLAALRKGYTITLLPGNPQQESFTNTYPVRSYQQSNNQKYGLFFVNKLDV